MNHKHTKKKTLAPEAAAPPVRIVAHQEIAQLAYFYWEARGCQGGSQQEDWLRAEQELKSPEEIA